MVWLGEYVCLVCRLLLLGDCTRSLCRLLLLGDCARSVCRLLLLGDGACSVCRLVLSGECECTACVLIITCEEFDGLLPLLRLHPLSPFLFLNLSFPLLTSTVDLNATVFFRILPFVEFVDTDCVYPPVEVWAFGSTRGTSWLFALTPSCTATERFPLPYSSSLKISLHIVPTISRHDNSANKPPAPAHIRAYGTSTS
jgi:hypothetical protein